MHVRLSPEEQVKRNTEDVEFSIRHMKRRWIDEHPPGTFMVRCTSNWNKRDGGLVMIIGYAPYVDNDHIDTCSDLYDVRVTVVACDTDVLKPIETLSVGEAKNHFLLELDRVLETRKVADKTAT